MKSDSANFFGRALGRSLILFGIIVGVILCFINIILGFVIGIIIIIYGKYLVFKADRRYGNVMYYGGEI